MGLIIGIPIFIFLLDVLDVNNEESIKIENKQKAIQKFWIAFLYI